jgi:hypothetical protein
MHQYQAIIVCGQSQQVHYTNIGLEKIKVHIRKLVPSSQKILYMSKPRTHGALLDHFRLPLHRGWRALGH